MGSFDLAAIAADVGETHVVGHDDDNVRFFRRRGLGFGSRAATEGKSGGSRGAPGETQKLATVESSVEMLHAGFLQRLLG